MDKIELKGYKSIRDMSLELRQINLLIGANGSGKSNLLSFFDFLKNIYQGNLQQYVALLGGMDRFLYEGRKVTDQIDCHLYFKKNGYSFSLKVGEGGFVFVAEGLWYSDNPHMENPVNISHFDGESRLQFASIPRAEYVREYLASLEKYHFHDTSRLSPFAKTSNINKDTNRLYDKGDNLAAFLYGIRQKNEKRYFLIVRTIQSIAPYFRDFAFYPNENGDITLQWVDKFSSYTYSVNDLSDGTKRFIALTALFLQPNLPQTIVIDEPELGLHPAAISKLAAMMKSAAEKDCQVVIATQSIDLINHFQPEDIITVDQADGESRFNRLNSEALKHWLEDYSVGDLWRQNIIHSGQPGTMPKEGGVK